MMKKRSQPSRALQTPTKKYDEAQQQKDESDPFRNWLDEVDPAEYTNDYHGMNPDDYYDMQDDLAMWCDDVLGTDHSTGRPYLPQQRAPVDSTPVCEDEILFASIAEKHCYVQAGRHEQILGR